MTRRDSIAHWLAWLGLIGLTACTPVGESVRLPDGLAAAFLVPIDETGTVHRAPLGPLTSASREVFSIPADTEMVVVGWTEDELDVLHPRFSPDRAAELRLGPASVEPESCPHGRISTEVNGHFIEVGLASGAIKGTLPASELEGIQQVEQVLALTLHLPAEATCRENVEFVPGAFAEAIEYLRSGDDPLGRVIDGFDAAGLNRVESVLWIDEDHVVVVGIGGLLLLTRGEPVPTSGPHFSVLELASRGLPAEILQNAALGPMKPNGRRSLFVTSANLDRFEGGLLRPHRAALSELELGEQGIRFVRSIHSMAPTVGRPVRRELEGLAVNGAGEVIAVGTELVWWNGTSSTARPWDGARLTFAGFADFDPNLPHVLGGTDGLVWLGDVSQGASSFGRSLSPSVAASGVMRVLERPGDFAILTEDQLTIVHSEGSERVPVRIFPNAESCAEIVDECGWAEYREGTQVDLVEYAPDRFVLSSWLCESLFRVSRRTGCTDVLPVRERRPEWSRNEYGLRGLHLSPDGALLVTANPGQLLELRPR